MPRQLGLINLKGQIAGVLALAEPTRSCSTSPSKAKAIGVGFSLFFSQPFSLESPPWARRQEASDAPSEVQKQPLVLCVFEINSTWHFKHEAIFQEHVGTGMLDMTQTQHSLNMDNSRIDD